MTGPADEGRLPAESGPMVVCFGDSITHGYGVESNQAYPAILARLLKVPVANAGADGDTIAGAQARLDSDVLRFHPRLVLVELGANDYLSGVAPERAKEDLQTLVGTIRATGAKVVLLSLGSQFWGDEYEDALRQVAGATSSDFMTGLLDGIADDAVLTLDGIHPNATGYIIIARRVAEFIAGEPAARNQLSTEQSS